ncbi:PPE domain-containing protein [Amycolatopsis magusensis]|uniref:PPE domain-containing protein n=1 Tax=Amycolatopsis magusensis TaxID=882444 RepID=UPI003C2DF412
MEYNEHRKKRYRSEGREPTARQRARDRKVRRRRQRNWRQDDVFAPVNWQVYEHRQLWDMIKSAEPGSLGEVAHDWGRVAKNVDQATEDIRRTVQKLMYSWRGPSAAKAAESVSALTTWAARVSGQAHQVGGGLDAYTSAIVEAQHKMPEPVHYHAERWFRHGYDVKALDGPQGLYMMDLLLDDHLPTKKEATEAKAEAVRVMKQYESASKGVHSGLPQPFDAAPAVAVPDAEPAPPAVAAPEESPSPSAPAPVVPAVPEDGPLDTSTHAAGLVPGGGSTTVPGPVSGGPGVGGPTVGVVPGAGAAGGVAAGMPGPGVGGGVAGIPGGPRGGGVAGTGPGLAGGGARGGGGGLGSAFYPPQGQGAGREEDKEHRVRWADGLDLMDDLPPAYPSVLGE